MKQIRWNYLPIAIGAALAIGHIACLAEGLKLELNLVSRSSVNERFRAGAASAADRQGEIDQLFKQVGCQTEKQQIDKRSANVICKLPGETDATIVIGGHFDYAEEGTGMVDDWSGASLLPSLYQTLKDRPRKHTYEFVAFAGEERGLLGSSHYVKKLSAEQRARIAAFINLECLGLTPPKVWVHRSTPILVDRLAEIARAVNIPLQGVNVDKVGDDDTHPFLLKKIPVISIHSVTQETWGILHSRRDNVNAIHSDDYYDAYQLVAFYLAYLDVELQPSATASVR
ncbi:MAG: M28 family metallopeptidase [Bryobacteraceae bacterium]